MESSPEMEKFGVAEEDYEYMFDPLNRRRFSSKKKQIYGIFASDSDSDIEQSGMASTRKRKGSNYSGPITFVSGGIKEGSKSESSTTDKDNAVNVDISDEEEDLRLFSSKQGESLSAFEQHTFAKPASVRQRKLVQASSTQGFGSWERHTKGIGMKLLQKMGFKAGEGLGKDGQGIVTPVEAVKRVGKGSIGLGGPETAPAPRRGFEVAPPPEVKEDVNSGIPRYRKKQSSVNGTGRPRQTKPVYLTADEVIASVSPATPAAAIRGLHGSFVNSSELSKVKVIDMTQKEQRVYDGYEAALSGSSRRLDEDAVDEEARKRERRIEGHFFEVPVLCHNVDLVVKTAEDEIRRLDRGSRYEEDRAAGLEHEIERLTKVVEHEAFEVDELSAALNLMSEFETVLRRGETGSSAEACSAWLHRIRRECIDLPELPALLAAVARPLLDSLLSNWRPLANPNFGVSVLRELRAALEDESAFELLLRSSWLPVVRRVVSTEWEPRCDCEHLLALLEAWQSLLPQDLLQHDILDGVVLPRLATAVDLWDPLTDVVPIHTWLHPWLPWFGGAARLAMHVHEPVLTKLARCLTSWHPSDASASSVLAPWRAVVAPSRLTDFLARHILPKLAIVLQSFQINPANQKMEPWQWVMRWVEIAQPSAIADLLERYFLPRWLQCLSDWLLQAIEARNRHDTVNSSRIFGEIAVWYSGWKNHIPPDLTECPAVKQALAHALSLMHQAMQGVPPTAVPAYGRPPNVPMSYNNNAGTPHRPMFMAHPPPGSQAAPPTNLRDQVEQAAQARGLLFMPLANRLHEGKQIYRLENQQIYFDRNVAFCLSPHDATWNPISFNELIALAE